MGEALELNDSNKQLKYTFRFGTSDKYVHLNQQQLDCIPYLMALVLHKDDFLSIQNENNEYVLSHPIEYDSFMVILHSITSKQPYTLFNELSEDNNILDTLQLFDYLGIDSFSSPFLKNEDLVRLNSTNNDNDKNHIEYHQANIFEARQTAAEFIITLGKNEYNLNDFHTKQRIFYLIKVILFNETLFSSTFRHHTLTVVKEYCYSYFSKKQQHLLPTTQQIAQHRKIDSFMYLYNDDKPLPDNFRNVFAWKAIYMPIEENHMDHLSASFKNGVDSSNIKSFDDTNLLCSNLDSSQLSDIYNLSDVNSFYNSIRYSLDKYFRQCFFEWSPLIVHAVETLDRDDNELDFYEAKRNVMNNEAQSARSGRFNTLPKRITIDKFKHRFGSKNQKYR